MSVTAAIIYDRLLHLETVYGKPDYSEALAHAALENDAAMEVIEGVLIGLGWREPA